MFKGCWAFTFKTWLSLWKPARNIRRSKFAGKGKYNRNFRYWVFDKTEDDMEINTLLQYSPRREGLSRIPPSLLAKCRPGHHNVNTRPGGQQPKPTKQERVESHFLSLSGPEHAQFRAIRHRSFIRPLMSRHASAIVTKVALGEVRRRKVVKVRERERVTIRHWILTSS